PAVVPALRRHVRDRQRPEDFQRRLERVRFHRADVHPGHRLGLRQGQHLQVHQRRLPAQHRHHLRHRRPGRRAGRLRAADHVRRPDGPHRHPFQRLHADVRRGLGFPDLDVLHRGARHPGHGRLGAREPVVRAGSPGRWHLRAGSCSFLNVRRDPRIPGHRSWEGLTMATVTTAPIPRGKVLHIWTPEDKSFWEREGEAVAKINLWISVPALFLAFAIWQVWSVVAVGLPSLGFKYSTNQLFWLAAAPALSGATLRIFYSFMVPIVGGRRWTAISTASLLIPALGIGFAVQDNTTSYPTMLVLALLCGLGGGNFSSSMANISFFFPKERKGSALGVNAGLGNLGVSVVQFLSPLVVTAGIFGVFGGDAQTIVKDGHTVQVWT